MLNALSYNQIKLYRFIASVFLIGIYILDIAAKPYFSKGLLNILVIIALLLYIASLFMFIGVQRQSKKVMMDELSRQNETKAAQFTYLLLTAAVFAGIVFTRLIDKSITLSYEVLFCILIAISAVNDGYYLFLEGRAGKDADADDED